jgi:hypothetical protein
MVRSRSRDVRLRGRPSGDGYAAFYVMVDDPDAYLSCKT